MITFPPYHVPFIQNVAFYVSQQYDVHLNADGGVKLGVLFIVLFSLVWCIATAWFWVTGKARLRGGGVVNRLERPVAYYFVMVVFTVISGLLIWLSYVAVLRTFFNGT